MIKALFRKPPPAEPPAPAKPKTVAVHVTARPHVVFIDFISSGQIEELRWEWQRLGLAEVPDSVMRRNCIVSHPSMTSTTGGAVTARRRGRRTTESGITKPATATDLGTTGLRSASLTFWGFDRLKR